MPQSLKFDLTMNDSHFSIAKCFVDKLAAAKCLGTHKLISI